MACELQECCRFFDDKMAEFPQTAEYIKSKLCFGQYERCTRYRIYKGTDVEGPPFHHSGDEEDVAKIAQCLREKQGGAEERRSAEPRGAWDGEAPDAERQKTPLCTTDPRRE